MTRYAIILGPGTGPGRQPICGFRMRPGDPKEDLQEAWEIAGECGKGCGVEVVRVLDVKKKRKPGKSVKELVRERMGVSA
jgi:hypothetical protein